MHGLGESVRYARKDVPYRLHAFVSAGFWQFLRVYDEIEVMEGTTQTFDRRTCNTKSPLLNSPLHQVSIH